MWLDDDTELYPDLAILRHRDDFYRSAHPRPGDVLVVIEVSDTTLQYDRQTKIPHYCSAGIPEAWLVDLEERRVETWRSPAGDRGYRESTTAGEGEAIESTAVPGLAIDVDELIP